MIDEKMLSIVIPCYNETWQELCPLISSINNQIGIDHESIEIIYVNDGCPKMERATNELKHELFTLQVKTVILDENVGPGMVRQRGLDEADGKYVMFCDADDVLHNVGVLQAFFRAIQEHNEPDIITSQWLEETANKQYVPHEDEATWHHGKLYKTSMLKSYGIKFHENLRVHEDSYFNAIAFEMAKSSAKLPHLTYVWQYRENSITRENNASYSYNSIPTYIYAIAEAIRELNRRGLKQQAAYKVVQSMYYLYFCFHGDDWLQEDKAEYLHDAETAFVTHFQPFAPIYNSIPDEIKKKVYSGERTRLNVLQIETETLNMWLNRINYVYKQEE